MSKKTIVFKRDNKNLNSHKNIFLKYNLKIWKPDFFNLIPPNKSIKYLIYWIFSISGVFKNKNYSSYLLYDGEILVSSLLVVPAYYKWPFMEECDVQFTYVMTNKKYRGLGLASKVIQKAMSDLKPSVDNFWYITDTENIASMKVAEKNGFRSVATAKGTKFLKILQLESKNI